MTEVQLYEEPGFVHWQPFVLWLLGHSIKSADAATSEDACRQLCQLWPGLKAEAKLSLLTAIARLPQPTVSAVFGQERALAEMMLEAAVSQHGLESTPEYAPVPASRPRRLLFSPYLQDLFEVLSKGDLWKLMPHADPEQAAVLRKGGRERERKRGEDDGRVS